MKTAGTLCCCRNSLSDWPPFGVVTPYCFARAVHFTISSGDQDCASCIRFPSFQRATMPLFLAWGYPLVLSFCVNFSVQRPSFLIQSKALQLIRLLITLSTSVLSISLCIACFTSRTSFLFFLFGTRHLKFSVRAQTLEYSAELLEVTC